MLVFYAYIIHYIYALYTLYLYIYNPEKRTYGKNVF